jgi:hypothetical protein
LAENGWTSGPRLMKLTPSGVPSRSSGVVSIVRLANPALPHAGHRSRELRFGCCDVLHLERLAVAHNPSG